MSQTASAATALARGVTVLPDCKYNDDLVDNVSPIDWPAVVPQGRYNLVVIGAGPAGLVAALGAAGLGAKVAIIEKHLLGGDCLNMGCVPSKALISSAHAAHAAKNGESFGVFIDGAVRVDFGKVMERMRRIRAEISHHDSATRLADSGVDVFLGTAAFTGPNTVEVNGTTIEFASCCIATGARAAMPPIPGFKEAGVRTNEQFFELTKLPERLVVVGAGPIGCEMAQSFARFGSKVTLIDAKDRVLPNEEPEASQAVAKQLQADGMTLLLGASVVRFESGEQGKVVVVQTAAGEQRLPADEILMAVGRKANVTGMNLELAGVEVHAGGITVNDQMQTTNPAVYAAGDVASTFQFTHSADHMARIVIQNALFSVMGMGTKKASSLVIPWATYTQPEVAHVGLSHQAAESRDDITAWTVGIGETDRGRCDGEDNGYCRIYADSKGRIHGATIVANNAGDLLAEVTLAMTHNLTLNHIASTIHSYPTKSDVVFKVASAFRRTKLTPMVKNAMQTWLEWRR